MIPKSIEQRITWKQDKKLEGDPDRIVNIRPLTACEDCGNSHNSVRVVQHKLVGSAWWSKCTQCGGWRNPDTGRFDFTNGELRTFYHQKQNSDDK
jgi:hypothetical protein